MKLLTINLPQITIEIDESMLAEVVKLLRPTIQPAPQRRPITQPSVQSPTPKTELSPEQLDKISLDTLNDLCREFSMSPPYGRPADRQNCSMYMLNRHEYVPPEGKWITKQFAEELTGDTKSINRWINEGALDTFQAFIYVGRGGIYADHGTNGGMIVVRVDKFLELEERRRRHHSFKGPRILPDAFLKKIDEYAKATRVMGKPPGSYLDGTTYEERTEMLNTASQNYFRVKRT